MSSIYLQLAGLALALVVLLILVPAINRPDSPIRRAFVQVSSRRLKAVERLPLAPGHTAVILSKDGVEYFVLLSPSGARELTGPPSAAAPSEPTQ